MNREEIEHLCAGGLLGCAEAPYCKDPKAVVGFFHADPNDFRDVRLRRLVGRILGLVQAGEPVTLLNLQDGDGLDEAYLEGVQSKGAVLSTEVAHYSRLLRKQTERETEIGFYSQAVRELQTGDLSVPEFRKLASEHVEATAAGKAEGLKVYTSGELQTMEIPERRFILEPFFREKDALLIHARRGGCKTWLSTGLAVAAAAGGQFLKWTAPRPIKTTFVDSEMPGELLVKRLRIQAEAIGKDPGDNLRVICADLQDRRLPNLADPAGQDFLDQHLEDSELLVLDNISTAFQGMDENDALAWEPAMRWLLDLRRRGVAVVLVHHSGKGGAQRGTSRREDPVDTVINLRAPERYAVEDGAYFRIVFEKGRALVGPDMSPISAKLVHVDGRYQWTMEDTTETIRQDVKELYEAGMNNNEIAKHIGKNRGWVSRVLKDFQKETEPVR